MKFQYYKLPLLRPSPVDGQACCYRPMMMIELAVNGRAEWFDALVDSGADYNMAPTELAEVFEIDLGKYPTIDVGGIEQTKRIQLAMVPVFLSKSKCLPNRF